MGSLCCKEDIYKRSDVNKQMNIGNCTIVKSIHNNNGTIDNYDAVEITNNNKTLPFYKDDIRLSSIDVNQTIYAVCDEVNVSNRLFTKLIDVYDCDEWKITVIEYNCQHLCLVALTYDEFLSLPNAEVLSYRWNKIKTISCSCYAPGESNPSDIRTQEIALDVFRKLHHITNSFLWVDYLSHLGDEQHKKAVISRMGSLYLKGSVFPLYLQDYYSGHYEGDLLSLSLRRGWIQQEISFGKLNNEAVKKFVESSIKNEDFGILGTLVRRRAQALKWSFEKVDIKVEPNMNDDSINPNIKSKLKGACGFLGPSPPNRFSPLTSKSTPTSITGCIEKLVKSQSSKSFVDELTSVLCEVNKFDPNDLFSAFSLLRSFAESELTYEADAYVAMTQVPAVSCGLADMNDPYLTVLRKCWLTLLNSDIDFEFNLNRKVELDKTMGLHETLPHIQEAIEQDVDFLIINIGASSRQIIFSFILGMSIYVITDRSDVDYSDRRNKTITVDLTEMLRLELLATK